MAKKKIKIDVEVNGKMEKATVSAKKLSGALKETQEHAHTTDRRLKGASQQSANTTKNFSKMAQGISGGLVPAYATLAANVFALSAAYGFLKRAGDLAALRQAQQEYAYSTGTSMKLLTSRLQEATGGILAFDEAAQAAAIGTAAGLSSDQLEGLAKVARQASAALGRDLTDSFNRLTKGAIKAEPELLDELGIIIRLERATEDYKRSLNIVGRELNTFEKTQAVVNAVLEQGVEKFEDIGEATNEIAKLGKATDDLIKSIQTTIVPVATFIANVLAKNVVALGAAAAVMGAQFIRAISPVGPALANVSEASEAARARLMAGAGPSKIGQEIAGGQFGPRQFAAIEKAAGSKTSKVINLSKMERNQIKRDLALIKADHQATMAANSTGMKKYVAGVKAQFYAMQAEHGKTMGIMKFGLAGLASFASKAMNAIAILGMITLAISMAKALIDLLKSDELKKLEEKADTLASRFKEQNEEVSDLIQNLKEAETPMGRLVQLSNIMSNLSFSGTVGLQFAEVGAPEQEVYSETSAVTGLGRGPKIQQVSYKQEQLSKSNEVLAGTLPGLIESLRLKSQLLEQNGIDVSNLNEKIEILDGAHRVLAEGVNMGDESTQAYDQAVRQANATMSEAIDLSNDLGKAVTAQAAAVKGLTATYENFEQLKEKFQQAPSNLTQFTDILSDLQDKLQAAGTKKGATFAVFEDEDVQRIASILNIEEDILRTRTVSSVIQEKEGVIAQKMNTLRQMELGQLTDKFNIEKDYQEALLSHVPTVKREAAEKKKLALFDRDILTIREELTALEILGITMGDQRYAQKEAEINQIKAQKAAYEQSISDLGFILDEVGKTFENNLGNAFDALFQSLSDKTMDLGERMKEIGRSLLQDIQKAITQKMFVEPIMKQVDKGIDFLKNKAGAEKVDPEYGLKPLAEGELPPGVKRGETPTTPLFVSVVDDPLNPTAPGGVGTDGSGAVVGTDPGKVTLNSGESASYEGNQEEGEWTKSTKKLTDSMDTNALETARNVAGLGAAVFALTGNEEAAKKLAQVTAALQLIMLVKDAWDKFMQPVDQANTTANTAAVAALTTAVTASAATGGMSRYGAVWSNGSKMAGYASGGVAKGPDAGYPVTLHGTEAVVPLPNNKSIPVEISGKGAGATTNNTVTVNVSTADGNANTQMTDREGQGENLGRAISTAVQQELQRQKRPGGILSPIGAA